jgi:bifunctional N-acetylglucosamine-1-phosphate-uridyltransferase/glucosamine-1-phosphate-acetyltransferase GlmU-like protein
VSAQSRRKQAPAAWRAVVCALEVHDGFRSRVSPFQHPLLGRPVLWHVVAALLGAEPAPAAIKVLHRADEPVALPDLPPNVEAEAVAPGGEWQCLRAALAEPGITLLVDGAAALLSPASTSRLVAAAANGVAVLAPAGSSTRGVAVAGPGGVLAALEDPFEPVGALPLPPESPGETLRVTDRHALSDAVALLRDRLVRQHEANGVTFLLPSTVLLDVGVRIGADTVIYPGVALEGATVIGGECVIGPWCRLSDASIGRGVELGGWNYVHRTSVRNHAVLEPFARRGYE